MADIPFAVDISQPEPSTGGNLMYHVRAANVDEFIRRIQDLQARVPGLAPFVVVTGAAARAQLQGPPADVRATNEVAQRRAARESTSDGLAPSASADANTANMDVAANREAAVAVIPVCDIHGKSRWSQAFHGLYCPKKRSDDASKWCPWKHECGAACAHPAESAAA